MVCIVYTLYILTGFCLTVYMTYRWLVHDVFMTEFREKKQVLHASVSKQTPGIRLSFDDFLNSFRSDYFKP